MNNIIKTLIGVFLVTLLFATCNCTYKNAQDVYPIDTSNCKTANMSYRNDVVPIFTANHCYDCHSSTTYGLGGNYRLDTYAYVVSQIGPDPQFDDILYGNISDPVLADKSHM